MKLKFYGEELPFELTENKGGSVTCLLVHSDEIAEKFERLLEAEEAREAEIGLWYLDENGERLESKELFAASPWSLEGPDGEIKLLKRIHKVNGEIRFDTLARYDGELFKWLR